LSKFTHNFYLGKKETQKFWANYKKTARTKQLTNRRKFRSPWSENGVVVFACDTPIHQKEIKESRQGDRIGRFFAHCAIVYFGHFSENDKSIPSVKALY
jgi:hypothetical protein